MEVRRFKDTSDTTSKYRKLDRIEYDTGEQIIETADRIEFAQDQSDSFWTVEAGYEDRLDLISYKFYKTSAYWWAIAAASNIDNPFSVPVGTVIRIPTLSRVVGW